MNDLLMSEAELKRQMEILEECEIAKYGDLVSVVKLRNHIAAQAEAIKGLTEALIVIRKGLGEGRPYEGYFPMRKFLRDHDIFEGDLQEDAVIVAVIDAALAAVREGK